MATRTGLRPRKSAVGGESPTIMDTPAARKVRKPAKVSPGEIISCVNQFRISSETLSSPILTPMQGLKATTTAGAGITDSTKFDAFMDRAATPKTSSAIDTLMETPAPATTQPLYPNLAALTADTTLYPSLESKTPARRRLYAAATTGRRTSGRAGAAGRKSLATQTVLPVTPTKPIDNSTVPKTTFEFKFSAGLEEAGKKVLEELKMSSAALQAHMKEEAAKKANGEDLSSTAAESINTPVAGRRRFSAEHRKQFNKMASIADHYSAKRSKATVKPTTPAKKTDAAEAKSTRATTKSLKRKTTTEESNPSTPFKPPQTLVTSDTEMADDSPISRKKARVEGTPMTQPRHKMAKFATPGPGMVTPISKPLQAAGHQHGITRSTVVKQTAMKQSSLPRVIRKEAAAPSTPSKPLAVATPLKKETLLASPSKVRPPGTLTKPATVISQPGTPSPVKISVPIMKAPEEFEYRSSIKAPLFDTEKLHKAAAAAAGGAQKPTVRFADLDDEEEDVEEVEEETLPPASTLPAARSLFDSGVVLKPPMEKRKAVSQDEDDGVVAEGEAGSSSAAAAAPAASAPNNKKSGPTASRNKRVRMDIPEIKHISATPTKNSNQNQQSPVKSLSANPISSNSLLASVARKITQPVRNSRINQLAMPKKRTVLSPKTDGGKVLKPRWK